MAAWDSGIVMNEHGLPVWRDFGGPAPRTLDECAEHNWWLRDRAVRYVIRDGGAAVGLALVMEDLESLPYAVPAGTDFEVLDFFVAPKARRRGVGAEAARLVFERHRGNGLLYTL